MFSVHSAVLCACVWGHGKSKGSNFDSILSSKTGSFRHNHNETTYTAPIVQKSSCASHYTVPAFSKKDKSDGIPSMKK